MYRLKYTGALSALVFLFLLILIIYSNTFHAAWHLDDYQNINQNPHFHTIKNLNVSTLWDSLHSPVNQRIYRPVAMLSFRKLSKALRALSTVRPCRSICPWIENSPL